MSEHAAPHPQADRRFRLWPGSAEADRRGWLLRELLVVALATVGAIGSVLVALHDEAEGAEVTVVSVLLLGVAVAALPFRHRFPVVVLATVLGATLTYWAFFARGPVFVPLVVSLGQVVLAGRRRAAVVALVTGFLGFPWLGAIAGEFETPKLGQLVGLAAWLAFLLSVLEVIRSRRDRAREEARSQAEALRRRATEERLQIARELHDVVAHNMSLISIQAGVALHLMDQRPEQARESLSTIKEASKEALVELRSILGVLRQVDETTDDDRLADEGVLTVPTDAGSRSPVPGLHRLGSLVQRARAAGLDVEVDSAEDLTGLPRNVDLAAYRIIQESLTNVARHSNDKAAVVRVRMEDGALAVDVLDEGTATLGSRGVRDGSMPSAGAGHGIVGMRERAASVGGRLEAGPRPGRGFAVRAWLPVRGAGPDDDEEGSP
jgi:signal transduction histidine kinase